MTTEARLYPEIRKWLEQYLKDRYKGYKCYTTYETSRKSLDSVLRKLGIEINEARNLSIKVDVVGILKRDRNIKLAFVEVKDKELTLKDLGQLWGYTKLINPVESFLISPKGIGTLSYIFNVLGREDLLVYGQKNERRMKVAKWDEKQKTIDYSTLIPRI